MNDIRFTLAASRRILYRNGCDSAVAGHVTARAGSDGFWMTPFEYFDETTPDRAIRLRWDLVPTDDPHAPASSPASAFHSVIYRRRPDVGAIIHIHSHFVSVLVSTDRNVGIFNVGAALFHDEQAQYVDDGEQPSVDGNRMADCLGQRSVLLMRNHGALVVADTLENATVLAMMLEKSARYDIECRAIGGNEIADAEARRLKGQYHRYFLPQMWEANLRRLRVSDPGLFEIES
ncbi:MAG: class II aldolase/adducin family protein [Ilumatobacteraceae bacterium]